MSGQGRLELQPYKVWLVQKVRVTFDQSDAKPKPTGNLHLLFSRASGSDVLFLQLLIESLWYFLLSWLADRFLWIWFQALDWNTLSTYNLNFFICSYVIMFYPIFFNQKWGPWIFLSCGTEWVVQDKTSPCCCKSFSSCPLHFFSSFVFISTHLITSGRLAPQYSHYGKVCREIQQGKKSCLDLFERNKFSQGKVVQS